MARQKQNDEVPQTETTELSTKEENLQLKRELEELKIMVQQLTKTPAPQEDELPDDEIDIIAPNKLINITSLFYGGMTLRASNNKKIRFDRFGVTLPVTFEDLTYICSNHRSLAEEGCFFIHNQDAVKALYLQEYYKGLVNKQTIENLITLPQEKISDIYSNLSDSLKETVEDVIIQGIVSGDSKYSNRNKIDHISQLSGKNLYNAAQDQIAR